MAEGAAAPRDAEIAPRSCTRSPFSVTSRWSRSTAGDLNKVRSLDLALPCSEKYCEFWGGARLFLWGGCAIWGALRRPPMDFASVVAARTLAWTE